MKKIIILLLILLKSTFILSQTVDFDTTFGNNGKTHTGFGITDAKGIAGPFFQIVFIILSWYFRPADRKINFHNQKEKYESKS